MSAKAERGVRLEAIVAEVAQLARAGGGPSRADDTGGAALRRAADVADITVRAAGKHVPGGASWRLVLDAATAAALAERDPAALRAALLRLGAAVVAWVEDIDAREEATDAA